MVLFQVLHARFQVAGKSVLVRDSKDYHTPPIVPLEVYPLRDFTSGYRKEYPTSPTVTGLAVILKGKNGFHIIFGFNIN